MKKKNNLFHHPIIAPSVVAIIISLIPTFIPNGWTTLFKLAKSLFIWIKFLVSIPIWLLIILLLCTLATIIIFLILIVSSLRGESSEYTEDDFLSLKWRWKYGKFGIYELVPFCPHCDMQVYPNSVSAYEVVQRIGFKCEDCCREITIFDGSYDKMENLVKRKIQKNLRSGNYKKA